MICPACLGETPSIKDKHKTANCTECYVLSETWSSEEERERNCDCYAADHKKENLKGYKPLDGEILKLIELEKNIEKNQIAKDYYQDNLNKENEEELRYAREHPRESVRESL